MIVKGFLKQNNGNKGTITKFAQIQQMEGRQRAGLIIGVGRVRGAEITAIATIKRNTALNCILLVAINGLVLIHNLQFQSQLHSVSKSMQTTQTDVKLDPFFHREQLRLCSFPSKNDKSFSRGHWKPSEQECYTAFLRKNYHIMRSSRLRYHYKIFNAMAEEVGTRTSAQCKSHHQKMLKRADNRLENLLITNEGPAPAPEVQQNDLRRMTDQITTNRTNPYFMLNFGNKLLIVIDDRFVGSY